ncbi:capsular polysaccharide export protein, LipB/KpsS family [Mesorhizobium sp. ASY16-5R]|uniref:capsular polysaccharide export protein, LipB/KpsS family n=1 Tax=Mesorhizobium sp. ASY16-5R TaxID=3445772 RepID=UPI003FA01D42
MVEFYLDIPSHLWNKDSALHQEILNGYMSITEAILHTNNCFAVSPHRSRINDGYSAGSEGGISYVYHARAPGKNSYCIRPGPIRGLWYLDKDGYSGWSSIARDSEVRSRAGNYGILESTQLIDHYRTRFLERNESKYVQQDAVLKIEEAEGAEFIFFPLQVNDDEVLNLSSFTQVDIMRRLVDLSEAHKLKVVFKRHPHCRSKLIESALTWAAGHSHIQISDASVHQLIPAARSVVVLNSGVGLEALIHGAAVYSLAASEYRHLTRPVDDLRDLEDAFLAARSSQSQEVTRGIGYLLSEFFVNISDQDRLRSIVRQHCREFQAQIAIGSHGASPDEATRLRNATTLLLAIEKQISEVADVLLSSKEFLHKTVDQEQAELLLSRVARLGISRKRILKTNYPEIIRKYITLCHKAKDHEEALNWARALATHTGESDDLMLLAKMHFVMELNKEGFDYARAAAFHQNATSEALTYYSRRIIGKSPQLTETALECAERAHTLDPDDPMPMWLMARAHHIKGDAHTALRLVMEALGRHPEHDKLLAIEKKIRESIARKQGRNRLPSPR